MDGANDRLGVSRILHGVRADTACFVFLIIFFFCCQVALLGRVF
jgi:hypothetical protein